jgi:rsbT antagonist protein RsbS
MPVPILKQGDCLIASVQSALSDADLLELRDDLSERVGRFRSKGVIIDVTVLDVLDSFASRRSARSPRWCGCAAPRP